MIEIKVTHEDCREAITSALVKSGYKVSNKFHENETNCFWKGGHYLISAELIEGEA